MTAFARAPPAEVPTRRMSFKALLPAVAREAGFQILALAQNLRRQLDQGINFNLLRRLGC
jgi:hypothetical protein